MFRQYRVLILIFILLVSFSVINLFLSTKVLKNEPLLNPTNNAGSIKQQIPAEAATPIKKKTNKLVVSDPADYGIVSLSKARMPRSQFEWDLQMEKILEDSKILETPEGKEALDTMKTTRQEFNETMEKVDKEIEKFEKQREDAPIDENTEKRLQSLYKLKAMSKVLKDKVTIDPVTDRPIQNLDQ